MCGIWALFGNDVAFAEQCSSMWKIAHRGPDEYRVENVREFGKSVVLGFHRLAILDSKHGMQPMKLRKFPHLRLIYNGEIYNFKTVSEKFGFQCETHCDSEVVLHLYAKGGIEFAARHLDGVFAFCLIDVEHSKVFLARDTIGVRPLFKFLTHDGCLGICSEVKGLISMTEKAEEIEPFSPGCVEEYSVDTNGKVRFVAKSRFNDVGEFPSHMQLLPSVVSDDVHSSIRNLFSRAVEKRLISERRVGCLLSGGLDSSLVTALVVKFAKEQKLPFKVQTFSVGMSPDAPDIVAARKVAKYLDTDHHEIFYTAEDAVNVLGELIYHLETFETLVIRASIPMYLMAKYIRERTDTTVILSGEGSDELLQGYIYFHKAPNCQEADEESRRLLKDLYLHDVLRVDRCIAAHGLEARVPFLDHEFTSYILSLPPELRQVREGVEKFLLRSAFSGTGLIPDSILWRPKEGFSDGVAHIRKSMFEVLQEHAATVVNDSLLKTAKERYRGNPPETKEGLYYRDIFENYYPGCAQLAPYYWLPKWTNGHDPSARTLAHYVGE